MQKIKSLYKIKVEKQDKRRISYITEEVVPGSEWVLNGEGVATRKFDGTSCIILKNKLYKRYDCKKGNPPEGFIPCMDKDEQPGHWTGWIEVNDSPANKYHLESFNRQIDYYGNKFENNQTYELCGPKIQGNPEKLDNHVLIPHGKEIIDNVPIDFDKLKAFLLSLPYEGIVWHHQDGRMVKMRKNYFQ